MCRRKPNAKLKICLDPKHLHKAISREHHVISDVIFSEQGIPRIVKTDNGPHFQGYHRQFAEKFGFSHVMNYPNYPHGNGFIKSQVKNFKRESQEAKLRPKYSPSLSPSNSNLLQVAIPSRVVARTTGAGQYAEENPK